MLRRFRGQRAQQQLRQVWDARRLSCLLSPQGTREGAREEEGEVSPTGAVPRPVRAPQPNVYNPGGTLVCTRQGRRAQDEVGSQAVQSPARAFSGSQVHHVRANRRLAVHRPARHRHLFPKPLANLCSDHRDGHPLRGDDRVLPLPALRASPPACGTLLQVARVAHLRVVHGGRSSRRGVCLSRAGRSVRFCHNLPQSLRSRLALPRGSSHSGLA